MIEPTFKTTISTPNSDKVIDILNQALVDTLSVQTQAKFSHWNVKGLLFFPLHELFDKIYGDLVSGADTIAERIAQLGEVANGTINEIHESTNIPQFEIVTFQGIEFLKKFSLSLSKLANSSREAISKTLELKDEATADIFIEITRALDKDLWFLESHLNIGEK